MTNLLPTFRFGSLSLTEYPFSVRFGKDLGSPAQVVTAVESALRDGSITQVTKYDNRTVTISVLVEAPDMLTLAQTEALLIAEASKPRNEFAFNPGDGYAVDSVFDTYEASLTPEYDDDHDLNTVRIYTLTFEAHPWPRSTAKVTTLAVATAAATVIDSGSSTTGWTSPYGGTLSTTGSAVVSTYDPRVPVVFGGASTALERTGTIDTTVNKYIAVDYQASIPGYYAFKVVGGEPVAEIRREPAAVAGYTRSWFKVGSETTSVAAIHLDVLHALSTATSATLSIDQVLSAATLPVSGTNRQLTRVVEPGGSVTAEGDVLIQHNSAGLGQVVAFSHPIGGGYTPALRQWLSISATVVPYAIGVSGAYHSIATQTLYTVPISSVPQGDVQLWARLSKNSTAGSVTMTWLARSGFSTGGVGDTQDGSTTFNFVNFATWYMVPLARLTLPIGSVGPAGHVAISIQAAGSGVIIDEAWLFAMDLGRLTVVDCGNGTPATGTVSNRLKISAPSVAQPYGAITTATSPDWSDAHTPAAASVICNQTGHRFNPAGSAIFTVTSEVVDASVSFEHYPRWHTSAAT